ncbi:TauD/TfdA family dioxygenase [Streptomyces sp. NPDC001348]
MPGVISSSQYLDRHILSPAEQQSVSAVLASMSGIEPSVDEHDLEEMTVRAQEFPRVLRRVLHRFRTGHHASAGLLLSDVPFRAGRLEPTPADWPAAALRAKDGAARNAGLLLMLLGSLLGDVFAFGTQHGSNPVVDVFPIKGHETEQLGSSSEAELAWHNEDAFHPFRAEYVILFCLRNDQSVGTNFASAGALSVSEDDWKILSSPRFRIRPDDSHSTRFSSAAVPRHGIPPADLAEAFARMERGHAVPEPVAVLSGSPERPFIRIDPAFMETGDDPEADDCLRRLMRTVDEALMNVVLASGDVLVIDNRRAVHGRQAFQARYDGTDRWLKRVNVAVGLRRSHGANAPYGSRILL